MTIAPRMQPSRTPGLIGTPSLHILIAAGFLLTIWIATHPYFGVIHDARYYLLQTLHALDPARWNQDLFFKYGTQDSFSLFSNGYQWIVASLGISRANLLATLLGDMLWLIGLSALILSVLKKPVERIMAMAGVIMLTTDYGLSGNLSYAEPFVTPRLFSEAAVMGGLALALKRRHAWAAALFCLAFAVHPLMAIPAISLIAIHMRPWGRRTWIFLGCALLAGLIGAWLGLEPFARAKTFYDDDWFQIVWSRNRLVWMSAWDFVNHARTASVFAILGAFLIVAHDKERKLAVSLLAMTFISCAVSFLGADIAHHVLITNLQLWRSLWLATLASNAAILLLLLRSHGPDRTPLAVGITLNVCAHFMSALQVAAPFAMLLCVLWFLHRKLQNEPVRFLARITLLTLMIATLTVTMYALYLQLSTDAHLGRNLSSLAWAAVSTLGIALCMRRRPPVRWLLPILFVTFTASLMLTDQRSEWNRYVYGTGTDGGLERFLANTGTTYWEGKGVEALWFRARKPDYYSCIQGAQIVFFRPLALEWSRRQQALTPLGTEDFKTATCGSNTLPEARRSVSRAEVAAVCQQLPELDTLILNHAVPGLAVQSWTAPAAQENTATDQEGPGIKFVRVSTFYLYSCAPLREKQGISSRGLVGHRSE